MSVLLDTHIGIWWLTGQEQLPARQRDRLDKLAEREPPWLSDISLWEAQMLHAKGRLRLTIPFAQWLLQATSPAVVQLARISPEVILKLDALPAKLAGDPADRIILATVLAGGHRLFTYDRRLRNTGLVRIWK
ncbi:MAG: type II toxin-antitoxin system VapC family toxin [Verrucomicrobiae bacterium]|nr:type II toxin-antitoxin system VapC family toxin [Verrucomicrobiae bacterium]MDW8344595.1 type II toxin-antitoxin system VapC family toxin [Verrucomicrobiae bacterium]